MNRARKTFRQPATGLSQEQTPGALPNVIWLCFFLSGCTGLIYEVLWLKELRHLFGSAAYATASTLAVFFLGLALGGYVWGKCSARTSNPLRTYAYLELGISLSAICYFFLLDVYALIYTPVFSLLGHSVMLLTGVKFLLALGLLLPPAFCMGGTFPVMGQLLIRHRDEFGRTASFLYAVNTLGGALGAFAAGFYLPVVLGFKNAYGLTIVLNGALAALAFYLSRSHGSTPYAPKLPHSPPVRAGHTAEGMPTRRLGLLVFFSGFLTLSLEVLWTRMFAQVLMNDVYSFATILITFLIALALGGGLAHLLCRLRHSSWGILSVLVVLSGLAVGTSPWLFYHWTGGLQALSAEHGWERYLLTLFGMAAGVLLVPGILVGSVFPYLLKLADGSRHTVGETLGMWTAVNTLGAIAGALGAGFLLLPALGLWTSIGLMAVLYLGLSVLTGEARVGKKRAWRLVPALGAGLALVLSLAYSLPAVRLAETNREVLQAVWHGSDGIVSVVRAQPPHYPANHPGDVLIRVDNHHTLGGVGSLPDEQRQAHLPLWLHPQPRAVFFIGLATGITAGAALYHPVERVVICELVPEVVAAAKHHFGAYNNGLFDDKRVRIVVEDGRNYLLGTSEQYDVIIGDLFNLWVAGVGSLYTLEHFRSVRDHLKAGGIFAQWLPLYQLSEREFGIITRTMLEVFPQVTLWRGNFVAGKPIVALIGHTDGAPLQPDTLVTNIQALQHHDTATELLIDALASVKGWSTLTFEPERKAFLAQLLPHLTQAVPLTLYAGNLTANRQVFAAYPVNTDNRPVIEFLAPKTPGRQKEGKATWLTMRPLVRFFEQLWTVVPPQHDPYLQHLTPEQMGYVQAGLSYFRHFVYFHEAQDPQQAALLQEAQRWLHDYVDKLGLRHPALLLPR